MGSGKEGCDVLQSRFAAQELVWIFGKHLSIDRVGIFQTSGMEREEGKQVNSVLKGVTIKTMEVKLGSKTREDMRELMDNEKVEVNELEFLTGSNNCSEGSENKRNIQKGGK